MKYVYGGRVPFSQTGATEGFSVIGAAQIVEDGVCAFFAAFGKDNVTLSTEYNALWVFVKNKFQRRAPVKWNENITVESFLTDKTAATVVVDTVVKNSEGETAIAARTEVCVIDLDSQRIRRISSVDFPEDVGIYPSPAGFGFTRFPTVGLREEYKFYVPSTSIDMCGHVNNVEYLRFILNATSVEKEKTRPVRETEINFVAQAREGEELTVFSAEDGEGEFYEIKSGEKVVARCKLSRGEKVRAHG